MRDGLEIQIHPAGGGRLRYVRPSRAQVTGWSGVALLYLTLLALAAAFAPGALERVSGSEEYRSLVAERARQGERLQELAGRLGQLKFRGEALSQRARWISRAYGLPVAGMTSGGEPAATLPLPESIYAGAVEQGNRLRARIYAQLSLVAGTLAEIKDFEGAHPELVRVTPAACPLRGDRFVLTRPFGRGHSPFTRDPEFHAGLDLAAPLGTPIYAPAVGVVVSAGRSLLARGSFWWRYGNLVVLRHGDRFFTLYGHCQDLKVRRGQTLRQGELLATVGNTGWSTSPHLHYEVRQRQPDGSYRPVDPLLHIFDRHWPNEPQPSPTEFEPLPSTPSLRRHSRHR